MLGWTESLFLGSTRDLSGAELVEKSLFKRKTALVLLVSPTATATQKELCMHAV